MESKIYLTPEVIRKAALNIPGNSKIAVDRAGRSVFIKPDKNTSVNIQLEGLNIREGSVYIPVHVKRRNPVPVLPDISLSGQIILSEFSVQDRSLLHFSMVTDNGIINFVLPFIKSFLPPFIQAKDNDNYSVNLNKLIPVPYDIRVTYVEVRDGIEVGFV